MVWIAAFRGVELVDGITSVLPDEGRWRGGAPENDKAGLTSRGHDVWPAHVPKNVQKLQKSDYDDVKI